MAAALDETGPRHAEGRVADASFEQTDVLTDADLAIGDGDHGIGMRRGFEAALVALDTTPPDSVEAAFKAVGTAILSNTGGAAGAVFGTLFRAGAKAFAGRDAIDGDSFAGVLEAGLEAVLKRGGVTEGQKTMIDAVAPAARARADRGRRWACRGDGRRRRGRACRRRGHQGHDRHDRQGALARRAQHRPPRSRRHLDLADPRGDARVRGEGLDLIARPRGRFKDD